MIVDEDYFRCDIFTSAKTEQGIFFNFLKEAIAGFKYPFLF
jgi:hypothetical protein